MKECSSCRIRILERLMHRLIEVDHKVRALQLEMRGILKALDRELNERERDKEKWQTNTK